MNGKTLLLAIASFSLFSAASERTYLGYKVFDMGFPIAGGKTVALPVTDAGPIPAENQDFKVEAAGVSVQPSLFSPRRAALAWGFSLTAKSSKAPAHVVIEEVYPDKTATLLVDDKSPALKEKAWSGSSASVEATPGTTAWLFAEDASVFVFRFTITPAGGSPEVLYQPSWISRPAKVSFRQVVARING